MSSDKYPRVEFRAGDLAGPLAARAGSRLPLNRVAARDLDRYYAVLADELARLRLTRDEAMLILDSLNGTVEIVPESAYINLWAGIADGIRLDRLHEKWGVEGSALVARLQGLSLAGALAVVDASERYWQAVGRGEQPQPTDVGL